MALIFPQDQASYPAMMRFTCKDGNGNVVEPSVELYMPAGVQFADKVEYENIGLGALGIAATGGLAGGNASDIIQTDAGRGLILSEVAKKFSDKAGAVSRIRNKAAPNPNTRALFKQVSLRSFQFSFKLIPTSASEAETIKDIIKKFRTEMYPEDLAGGSGGSLGYKFPNTFSMEFFSNGTTIDGPKVDESYLEACSVAYNPTNQSILDNAGSGYFSEIDLNLTFTESRTLNRDKIGEGF
jgi:hypothetical protein